MKNETAMNGAGITAVEFPMWPQFAPETLNDVLEPIKKVLTSHKK